MSEADIQFEGTTVVVQIDQRTVIQLPPRVFRGRLTGMLFETDKVFLLPSAMNGIRGLARYYDQHPGLAVLVVGHTDTVGDPGYNERLSEERADSVAAFLTEDVDAWLAHYAGTPHSQAWGTREDQHMLSALPPEGPPHYTGPTHGFVDPPTREAIVRFQRSAGLVDDGIAGPNTRRALVEQYMALDETTLPEDATITTHGCGEHHPAIATADHVDEEDNRRVEVFLFEREVDPPPRSPCAACPEYPQWLARLVETVDFGVDLGWLDVFVLDSDGAAVSGAAVRIEGAVSDQAHTGGSGMVRFEDVPIGPYEVTVVADGFDDVEFFVGVTPGDPPPAPDAPPVSTEAKGLVADGEVGSPPSAGGGSGSGSGGQVGPNAASATLAKTDTIIHIIGEIPEAPANQALRDRVREGKQTKHHAPWGRVFVNCQWETSPGQFPGIARPVNTDGKAIYPLDESGKTKGAAPKKKGKLTLISGGTIQNGNAQTHPFHFTMRDPSPPHAIVDELPVAAGTTTKVKISSRLRTSLWTGRNNLSVANLGSMKGIDDLTILTTATNAHFQAGGDPKTLGVAWDDSFDTFKKTDQEQRDFYRAVIAKCHERRVQALVGFHHALNSAGGRAASFHAWMIEVHKRGAAGKAAIDDFAARLVEFYDTNVPDYDGVNFDIEHIAPINLMPVAAQAKFFTHFYRAVAKLQAQRNKFVAIATGMFDNQFLSVKIADLQQRFDSASTIAFAKTHPYQIAKGFPNIIIRPMAFGTESADKSIAGQQKWHTDIVEYAIETVGLLPGQFQLGFDIGAGNGEIELSTGGSLEQRCKELLRPNRVGIIGFAMSPNQNWTAVSTMDQLLNPDERPHGTVGQPVQSPLGHKPF